MVIFIAPAPMGVKSHMSFILSRYGQSGLNYSKALSRNFQMLPMHLKKIQAKSITQSFRINCTQMVETFHMHFNVEIHTTENTIEAPLHPLATQWPLTGEIQIQKGSFVSQYQDI